MKVKELLAKPENWCKGSNAQDSNGIKVPIFSEEASKWCLIGALHKCYVIPDEAKETISKIVARKYKKLFYLSIFNDNLETTHKDIMEVLEEADV